MSSATDTIKHPSEGDVPDPKRSKVDEKDALKSGDVNVENNNQSAVDPESAKLKKDTGDGSVVNVKASNGNDKEPEHDDGEQDDDVITGDDLDSDSEPMDPNVTRRLQQVQSIQQRISKLNELASEEILKVEQKFNKLRRPHFEERNELLKDIPNFWVTCLANHPTTTQLIETAEDEDCLHYMINLDVEELEDIKSGYNLKFHFKENPYIKNDLIVKELRHLNSDEVVSKSTPIEYKDTVQARSLKNLVDNSVRQFQGAADRVDHFSFFAWMCMPCETGSDEIAEIIKDQIWPSPLEFFFHQQVDEYDGNSDEDESDEEDYDEEDFGNDAQGEMPEEDIEGEELDDEDDEEGDDDDDDDQDDVDEEAEG